MFDNKDHNKGFVKFLGTAGARFVMIKQLRSSSGLWLNFKETDILIDPGPGAIVKCNSAKPKLDPSKLDAIILTHKHLDHSGDVNVMIEAMSEGGFCKRGILFLPEDALGEDGVVFKYLKSYVKEIIIIKEGDEFLVGDIKFKFPTKNIHSVMTYGVKFFLDKDVVSFVSDTKYFNQLSEFYEDSSLLVLNVVFHQRREEFQHLCLDDALGIIKDVNPEKAILTHFGMSILKQKPYILEKKIKKEVGEHIIFAYDGMTVKLPLQGR